MATAGILFDKSHKEEVANFCKELKENFSYSGLIRKSKTELYENQEGEIMLIVTAEPYVIINPIYMGSIIAGLFYVFSGPGVGFWIGVGIAALYYFMSGDFIYRMTKKALAKKMKREVVNKKLDRDEIIFRLTGGEFKIVPV